MFGQVNLAQARTELTILCLLTDGHSQVIIKPNVRFLPGTWITNKQNICHVNNIYYLNINKIMLCPSITQYVYINKL